MSLISILIPAGSPPGQPHGYIILDLTMPTQGLRVFACNTAFRMVSQNENTFPYTRRTPARTLVMSKTRMPANGRVGESAAAVARPLQSEQLEPLSHTRELKYLARPKDVLEVAIVHLRLNAEVEGEKKAKESMSSRSNNQPPPRASASGAEMFPLPQYQTPSCYHKVALAIHSQHVYRHSRSNRQYVPSPSPALLHLPTSNILS